MKLLDYNIGSKNKRKSNMKRLVGEIRVLVADYLLLLALKLHPKGAERDGLRVYLAYHFEHILGSTHLEP